MARSDLAGSVDDVLSVDADAFQERVLDEADRLKEELRDGTFDNPEAIVGLEYEFDAVTDGDESAPDFATLRRVPRQLLERIGFERELGLHNAELCTSPQPFNAHGLDAQAAEVRAKLATAQDCARAEGIRLVSDGLWTLPPAGETAREYLTDSVDDAGVRVAANMSDAVRYHAMSNAGGTTAASLRIDAPNVTLDADTVMPESLITSIQPHYQVPQAADVPIYLRYALRIAGPLLALGVNAPFFPPDCYDDVSAERVLEDAWADHRISVFETVLNPVSGPGKVRFPRDLDSVFEAVDRIANDDTIVPMTVERGDRFDDTFAHFRRKHGTYWRWVRPVFGGATRSAANARIEFRPLSAQPTIRDTIAFQAAFAGLMKSLPRYEHPVADQDWTMARKNFYAAMRAGIDADLRWVTNDGRETADRDVIYDDLLAHAHDGLVASGLDETTAADTLQPLRERVEADSTPARWKWQQVRSQVRDGAALAEAITEMQREYVRSQRDTLFDGWFTQWV
jgi:hypothetical protein